MFCTHFLVECRSICIFWTWCRNAHLEAFAIGKRAYPQPAILEAHHFWYSCRCCRKTQVREEHSICDRECLLQGPDTSELTKVVTGWEDAKGVSTLYGPMPVQTRTFREIWEPLVHMNFKDNSYGPSLGALFSGEICMDQWVWKFVEESPPDWH